VIEKALREGIEVYRRWRREERKEWVGGWEVRGIYIILNKKK
jgi:hypothetical protein